MNYLHTAGLAVICCAALLAMACGAGRETALAKTDAELLSAKTQGDFEKTVSEGDAAWLERMDRAKTEAALAKWEAATDIATPDLSEDERRAQLAKVYEKLARGYYFLSDTHVRFSGGDEDVVEEKMKATFEKGTTAAELGLGVYSKEYAKAIRYETPIPEAIKVLDKGAVPLMYWYATNVGKWALLEGFAEILSRKDNIKALMDFAEANNPLYFSGAPYRYFGAYYTKLPFPGGDIEKSSAYFEKAIAADPNYLATRVLFAELNATKAGDKELFTKQLQAVIDYDLSKAPELLPENTFEQRKAQALLANIEDHF
jgi:hypothetical protein